MSGTFSTTSPFKRRPTSRFTPASQRCYWKKPKIVASVFTVSKTTISKTTASNANKCSKISPQIVAANSGDSSSETAQVQNFIDIKPISGINEIARRSDVLLFTKNSPEL